jgi:CrcB protein
MQRYLLIALGGAMGSVTRFWVGSQVSSRMGARFPYGTFLVNISACLIIGFSLEYLGRHLEINPAWRYLIPIGFVGAYSTFSTFEWEILSNVQLGAFVVAGLYTILSLVLGLVAVWCGVVLARLLS